MIREQPVVDPEIVTLPEVLDPAALAKHLRELLLPAVEEVRVRALRHYVHQRCTLEIGLRTEKGWHFLIGKVYRKDHFKVFQVMEGIQQAGFGPRDEFSIPRPVAYLPSLRLLLQEKVEGPVAEEIFETGDERSRGEAGERCAQWLARFHMHAPKAGPVSDAREHLNSKSMHRCWQEMAKLDGDFEGKAARLLRGLEDAGASLSPVEMCAGHGGYRADHVILSKCRTVAFDLDTYDVADPARDVARFLAALRHVALDQLGSIRALDGAAETFLGAYLAAGPPEMRRNLHFFEAAAYLKRAKHSFCRQVPDWQKKTEAMLDEGLRALEWEAA